MKILWLINIKLPTVSDYYKEEKTNSGGWLVTLSRLVPEKYELVIVYPDFVNRKVNIDDVAYYGSITGDEEKQILKMKSHYMDILDKEKPDVIHIWGTEHLQSYAMTLAAKETGFLNKVIVSIQGMVSYYSLHYMAGLPKCVTEYPSLRDIVRVDSLKQQMKKMKEKGETEKKLLKDVSHVIGRTSWDYNCTRLINPNLIYHKNNEILRQEFYRHEWSFENCEKHTIFVSQAQYPIKGFHILLEAMNYLKIRYPDIKVVVAGSTNPLGTGIRSTRYQKYLFHLSKKYSLLEHIKYVGSLEEKEMCAQYLKAHVFVCPSVIENSPNSVGEAMLLGMPIVASYVGGTSNMLIDTVEGFLYPFEEAYMLAGYICRIFEDCNLAEQLGAHAKIHANKTHNVEKNFRDLQNIYADIT